MHGNYAPAKKERALAVLSRHRHVCAIVFTVVTLAFFRSTCRAIANLALQDDRYAYLLLIPITSAAFLYLSRGSVFTGVRWCVTAGVPALLGGMALYSVAAAWPGPAEGHLRLQALAMVWTWISGFLLVYGPGSARRARFGLFFLLLLIPLPVAAMDALIVVLQRGSAEMTYLLFKLTDVPVYRDGYLFSLPGVDITVAEECGGVHSASALLVASALAGRVLLRSGWRRLFLALLALPVAIVKNAIRIVVISSLGVYVDRGFLFGSLHRHGGLPFSLLSIAVLGVVLVWFQRSEERPVAVVSSSSAG